MKIKNNFSLNLKPLPIVFLISVLVSTIIRCVQVYKFIDPETGFSIGGKFTFILLYIILGVTCCYFSFAAYLSKSSQDIDMHKIKNPIVGSASLLFSVSLIFDSFSSFFNGVNSLAGPSSGTGVQAIMSTGGLPLVMQSLFAFISAIYFITVSVDFYKGKTKSSGLKLLAIAPVAWTGMRLIYRFIRQISFVEVSDLFMELIMLAFLILFFMAFAQVNSGVYSQGFEWRLIAFGLSAAVISATLCFSRLVFVFIESGANINAEHPFNFSDFAFSIFAVAFTFEIVSKLKHTETNTDENEVN